MLSIQECLGTCSINKCPRCLFTGRGPGGREMMLIWQIVSNSGLTQTSQMNRNISFTHFQPRAWKLLSPTSLLSWIKIFPPLHHQYNVYWVILPLFSAIQFLSIAHLQIAYLLYLRAQAAFEEERTLYLPAHLYPPYVTCSAECLSAPGLSHCLDHPISSPPAFQNSSTMLCWALVILIVSFFLIKTACVVHIFNFKFLLPCVFSNFRAF